MLSSKARVWLTTGERYNRPTRVAFALQTVRLSFLLTFYKMGANFKTTPGKTVSPESDAFILAWQTGPYTP